jgi:hypothetical protein
MKEATYGSVFGNIKYEDVVFAQVQPNPQLLPTFAQVNENHKRVLEQAEDRGMVLALAHLSSHSHRASGSLSLLLFLPSFASFQTMLSWGARYLLVTQ